MTLLVALAAVGCASSQVAAARAPLASQDPALLVASGDAVAPQGLLSLDPGPPSPPVAPACVVTPEAPSTACPAAGPCPVRHAARVACPEAWVASIAALDADRAALLVNPYADSRPSVLLGLAGGRLEGTIPLAAGTSRRLAADGQRFVDLFGNDPVARRTTLLTFDPALRSPAAPLERLPDVGQIVLGAARAPDGRLDALIALGGAASLTLSLAQRSPDGRWTATPVGATPWPYSALAHDPSAEALVAYCAPGATGATYDLTTRVGGAAPQIALRHAGCGDQAIDIAAGAHGPVVVFRDGDLRVVASGGRGRFVSLRVADTAEPRPNACAPLARTPTASDSRCVTRAEGASAHGLVRAGDRVWLVYLAHRIEIEQRVERRCHPVDRVGARPPPSGCEDTFTPLDDRSQAELVITEVRTGPRRPTLGPRVRLPLGRMPGARVALHTAAAGDVAHVIVSSVASGAASARYLTIDLVGR